MMLKYPRSLIYTVFYGSKFTLSNMFPQFPSPLLFGIHIRLLHTL